MEPIFGILGGVFFILRLVFRWGKDVGFEAARRDAERDKSDVVREKQRLEERLEKVERTHRIEKAAIEAALSQVRHHRDALLPATSLLAEVRSHTPTWMSPDPFLLLGPGQLREWAKRAQSAWHDIDQLSGPARIALEQAYNANVELTTLPAGTVPLVREAIEVGRGKPNGLTHNLFDLQSQHFHELAEWFRFLSHVAANYVVNVSQVEESERRRQKLAKTLENIEVRESAEAEDEDEDEEADRPRR